MSKRMRVTKAVLMIIGAVVVLFGLGVYVGADDNGWIDFTRQIALTVAAGGALLFVIGFAIHVRATPEPQLPQARGSVRS